MEGELVRCWPRGDGCFCLIPCSRAGEDTEPRGLCPEQDGAKGCPNCVSKGKGSVMDGGMRMHQERRRNPGTAKIGTSHASAPTHRSPCRTRRAAFSSHPLEKPRDVQGSMTQGQEQDGEGEVPAQPGQGCKGQGQTPSPSPPSLLSHQLVQGHPRSPGREQQGWMRHKESIRSQNTAAVPQRSISVVRGMETLMSAPTPGENKIIRKNNKNNK